MSDQAKIAKNLERFARAVASHDRENPTHTAWGIGLSHFDMERLSFEEGEEVLPGITIQPPGYTSVRSLGNILKGAGSFMLNLETWDQVVDGQYAIVGSPETVTDLLVENLRQLGTGNLLGLFQLGSLPGELTRKNLALFAEQVMPRLRAEFPEGAPVHRPDAKDQVA